MDTRAKGKNKNLNSDPDGDNLHEYWTRDPEGLAKWKPLPHPWTALYEHLRKYIKNDNIAKATASKWYREVFGHMPNQDKKDGKAGGGKNKFGPGRSDSLTAWLAEWRATGVGEFTENKHTRDPSGKFSSGGGGSKVAGKPVDKKRKPARPKTGIGHAGPKRRPKPGTVGFGKKVTKKKKPPTLTPEQKKLISDLEKQIALDSEKMTAAYNSGNKEAAMSIAKTIAANKNKIAKLQDKVERSGDAVNGEIRSLTQWQAAWEQRKAARAMSSGDMPKGLHKGPHAERLAEIDEQIEELKKSSDPADKEELARLQAERKRLTDMETGRSITQWAAEWESRRKGGGGGGDFNEKLHPRGPGGKFASKGGGGSGGGSDLPDISHLSGQGVSLDPRSGTIKKNHYERNKLMIKDTKLALDFEKSKPQNERNDGLIKLKQKQIDEMERENKHYEMTKSAKGGKGASGHGGNAKKMYDSLSDDEKDVVSAQIDDAQDAGEEDADIAASIDAKIGSGGQLSDDEMDWLSERLDLVESNPMDDDEAKAAKSAANKLGNRSASLLRRELRSTYGLNRHEIRSLVQNVDLTHLDESDVDRTAARLIVALGID